MIETLNALLDTPLLLLAILLVGGVIGVAVEKFVSTQERARKRAYWQWRNGGKGSKVHPFGKEKTAIPLKGTPERALHDAAEQLRCVMEADFRPRPLLNKSEGTVFRALDKIVIARNPGWQVMAQVSVGEFIATDDPEAFGCINSKRVDFVLMDENCQARHALEYQGNGHHQGSAAARDAVKKEALRKAGVGYHEIVAGHTTPGELRRLVERLVPVGGAKGEAA